MCLLITCETGGAKVPAWFPMGAKLEPLDRLAAAADQPARYAASSMAIQLASELIVNEYSCELIDLTRSLRSRQLFPKLMRGSPQQDRERLLDLVYRPYLDRVHAAIQAKLLASGFAIHLSLRSFNSRSGGKNRRADVGLLYDPSRSDEADLCVDWVNEMWWQVPMLRVRRNYPRRGSADGLIPSLRRKYAGQGYLGVEVWLNRAWAQREVAKRDEAISGICSSLRAVVEDDAEDKTAAA